MLKYPCRHAHCPSHPPIHLPTHPSTHPPIQPPTHIRQASAWHVPYFAYVTCVTCRAPIILNRHNYHAGGNNAQLVNTCSLLLLLPLLLLLLLQISVCQHLNLLPMVVFIQIYTVFTFPSTKAKNNNTYPCMGCATADIIHACSRPSRRLVRRSTHMHALCWA